MITLTAFQNYIEANLAGNYLRQNGIECFVADAGISSVGIVPGAKVRIMVAEEDLEEATSLLKNMQSDQ
ncbi:MAG: DUF2007 domain-containing protein [Gammaproteobacteria bacterium]|nr:DUF2007 domain-containing protein [Gammaproteobacteria bacterium]